MLSPGAEDTGEITFDFDVYDGDPLGENTIQTGNLNGYSYLQRFHRVPGERYCAVYSRTGDIGPFRLRCNWPGFGSLAAARIAVPSQLALPAVPELAREPMAFLSFNRASWFGTQQAESLAAEVGRVDPAIPGARGRHR